VPEVYAFSGSELVCPLIVILVLARWCLDLACACPDPNMNDNLQYAIVAGNDAGVFKMAACGGQIRVANAVLDFIVGPRLYNLTVLVADDGLPSRNTTAFVVIHVSTCVDLDAQAAKALQSLQRGVRSDCRCYCRVVVLCVCGWRGMVCVGVGGGWGAGGWVAGTGCEQRP
jgi:hypothetical protein